MPALPSRPARRLRRQAGFTLMELLVVMAVLGLLMAGVFSIFDVSNRVSQVQTQITDMQQSLRAGEMDVARYTRMAGRGGMPANRVLAAAPWLQGLAVDVRNNVGTGVPIVSREVAIGYVGSPLALVSTDILTVRGCFNTLYQVNETDPAKFTMAADSSTGTLTIDDPSYAGPKQPLKPLVGSTGRPLLIVSPVSENIYTVAEITGDAPDSATNPTTVTLNLNLGTSAYLNLAGGVLDPNLKAVGFACILEEYRYYIRDELSNPADPSSELAPRLTRAIMRPGFEMPLDGNLTNLSLDLADNVIDLQVALAFDSDYPSNSTATVGAFGDDADFLGNDDTVFEGADDGARATDDWLFNTPGDDISDIQWRSHRFPGNSSPVAMQYARVTLIARTDQRDGRYRAPRLGLIEDHDFAAPAAGAHDFNSDRDLQYRRRLLQSVVDLRNI